MNIEKIVYKMLGKRKRNVDVYDLPIGIQHKILILNRQMQWAPIHLDIERHRSKQLKDYLIQFLNHRWTWRRTIVGIDIDNIHNIMISVLPRCVWLNAHWVLPESEDTNLDWYDSVE